MSKMELIKYGSVQVKPNLLWNTYHTTNVIVVGCGGTGGRLIPALAQHIKNHNDTIQNVVMNKQFLKHRMTLTICDKDIVETKNLLRQNFYSFDVGKNKAEVLAKRFSALHGMDINFIPDYVTEGSKTFSGYYDGNTILFDCTDNLNARKQIEKQLSGQKINIISCGNEDTFGQVLFSCKGYTNPGIDRELTRYLCNSLAELDKVIKNPNVTYKGQFSYLPTLLEMYPNFKDSEKKSCTEMVLQDEQSMPINSLVAQLAFNMFYNLVAGNGFNYNMVKCSTNNIFDTKFVNHPIGLYELYLNQLVGDTSQNGKDCFSEATRLGLTTRDTYSLQRIKYEDVSAFVTKFGVTGKLFVRQYIDASYSLTTEQQAFLSNVISGLPPVQAAVVLEV